MSFQHPDVTPASQRHSREKTGACMGIDRESAGMLKAQNLLQVRGSAHSQDVCGTLAGDGTPSVDHEEDLQKGGSAMNVDVKKEHRVTATVAGAFIGAVVFFAGVVEYFSFAYKPFEGFAPQHVDRLREIFYIVAVMILFGIRMTRKAVLKKSPQDTLRTFVSRLRIATVMTFGLCEIAAALGLVLFLVGGLPRDFYILFLLSLLGMVVYFPRYDHWQAWIGREGMPA